MGMLDLSVAVEEIARADASVGLTVASHNLLCMDHIYLAGTEEQRHKYLASPGEWQVARGLVSDRARFGVGRGRGAHARHSGATERRRRVGLERRQELHHPGLGGRGLCRARLDHAGAQAEGPDRIHPGKGDAWSAPGRLVEKMGLWASDTADVIIEEVVVPDAQRLGQLDSGFFDTGKVLDRGRIGIGAWAVGIGRAAFEAARTYALQRVQFGKPIAEFQAIRTMLADMATELDAARLWFGGRPSCRTWPAQHARIVGGEVLRLAGGGARVRLGGADPRRLWLHPRIPRRALPARREAGRDRRGHNRNPEAGHRSRSAQGVAGAPTGTR
jgi:alkylation response protein AidB-like acyl-CoA dehydrogenase